MRSKSARSASCSVLQTHFSQPLVSREQSLCPSQNVCRPVATGQAVAGFGGAFALGRGGGVVVEGRLAVDGLDGSDVEAVVTDVSSMAGGTCRHAVARQPRNETHAGRMVQECHRRCDRSISRDFTVERRSEDPPLVTRALRG